MKDRWRRGFDIDLRLAGRAPLVGILVGVAGVVLNAVANDGDLRVGILPWTMAFAMVCIGLCALGVLRLHGPVPSRAVLVGAWWTTLAVWGIAGFFLALGIGELVGLDEEDAGLAVVPPLLGMMFGAVSLAPAMATLALGMGRSGRLPRRARTAAWLAVPAVPALLLLGITEGAVETSGSLAAIILYGSAWITVGGSVAR